MMSEKSRVQLVDSNCVSYAGDLGRAVWETNRCLEICPPKQSWYVHWFFWSIESPRSFVFAGPWGHRLSNQLVFSTLLQHTVGTLRYYGVVAGLENVRLQQRSIQRDCRNLPTMNPLDSIDMT